MNRLQPHLLAVACLVACTGSTSLMTAASSSASSVDSALQTTQCTYQSFNADVTACFAAFKTCLASSEEATADDCRATLHACLPPPPARDDDGGQMAGCGPGGMNGTRGGPGGDGPGHGRDGVDGGEVSMSPPLPDPTALATCHDAFTACVSGGTVADTCFSTEHACVKAAFEAAFQAACDATNDASPHCQQGVDGLPPAADGGTVCAADAS